MPLFEIKHRFLGAVLFSLKTGSFKLCVEAAVKSRANLARAYLADADLAGADLADANLAGADLAGAYLADANLAGANLARADLADADLAGAYLADANLAGANLAGANLAGAYLADANLAGANLAGAKIHNSVVVTKSPIQILGLTWPVTIWDAHMKIGCEFHSHDEWAAFNEHDWIRMGGKPAALMLRNDYPAIKLMCERHAASVKENANV